VALTAVGSIFDGYDIDRRGVIEKFGVRRAADVPFTRLWGGLCREHDDG